MNTDGPLVTEPNGNGKRKRLLISAGLIFLIIGLAWIAYWFFISRYHQSTDDAYVAGDIVQITPQVNGTVVSIDAEDTDYVMPGKILVKLNPDDAEVALQQAEAQLAQAVRQARTLYSNDKALIANIDERRAELQNAQAEAEKARLGLHRREVLAPAGAVSKEELQHARVAVDNALNVVAAAKSNLAGNEEHLISSQALTEGTSVENQPSVQQAAAHMKEAYLARVRCDIASPVEGQVAKRNVQIGQRVQTGAPLMAIIPLKQVWVDANFKEDQLHNMRIGQPVHLYSDLYGDNIEYSGKIAGLGAGTGAAFSLLPAQNATGNWIKIVQRIPVRIALDPSQLKKYPLRVGLSMQAKVDTQDTNGKLLSDTPRTQPVSMTNIQDNQAAHAEALVKSVIEKNLGSHKALNPSGSRALSSASKSSASGKS